VVRANIRIDIIEYDGVDAITVSVTGEWHGRAINIPRLALWEPMAPERVRTVERLIQTGGYRLLTELFPELRDG